MTVYNTKEDLWKLFEKVSSPLPFPPILGCGIQEDFIQHWSILILLNLLCYKKNKFFGRKKCLKLFSSFFFESKLNDEVNSFLLNQHLKEIIRQPGRLLLLIEEQFSVCITLYRIEDRKNNVICHLIRDGGCIVRQKERIFCLTEENVTYSCIPSFALMIKPFPDLVKSKDTATFLPINSSLCKMLPSEVIEMMINKPSEKCNHKEKLLKKGLANLRLVSLITFTLPSLHLSYLQKLRRPIMIFKYVGRFKGDKPNAQNKAGLMSIFHSRSVKTQKEGRPNECLCLAIDRYDDHHFNVYLIKPSIRFVKSFLTKSCGQKQIVSKFDLRFKTVGFGNIFSRKVSKSENCEVCPCRDQAECNNAQKIVNRSGFKTLPMLTRALGWDCPENDKLIRLASNISMGFFDVEASTEVNSKNLSSRSRHQISFQTDQYLEGGRFGSQSIIMIGYGDLISLGMRKIVRKIESRPDSETVSSSDRKSLMNMCHLTRLPDNLTTRIFHIGKNGIGKRVSESNFSSREKLVKNFMQHVHKRSMSAYILKKILLAPYITCLNAIKKKHSSLSDQPFMHNSLYSDFEKALNKFLNVFILFSFNGAGYDHCIIMPYLMSLYSKQISSRETDEINIMPTSLHRYKINILKRGSKICFMKFVLSSHSTIIFRDFKHLENPYMSLAKLTDIYCTSKNARKGLFPHTLSTSIRRLKAMKKLPPSPSCWVNLLTGANPSQAEINQAISDFEEKHCVNLYEYLSKYLVNDVMMTREACFFHKENVWNMDQVDYIAAEKYTISSLSFYKAFTVFPSNKPEFVSVFATKNPITNRLIDASVVGGLTICGMFGDCMTESYRRQRTSGNKPPHKINEHLLNSDVSECISQSIWPSLFQLKQAIIGKDPNHSLIPPADQLECKSISTFDIMSLYASAMQEDLPYGEITLWNPQLSSGWLKCPGKFVDQRHFQNMSFKKQSSQKPETHTEEYFAIRKFLSELSSEEEVIHVRSGSHSGGRVLIEERCYPDLFLVTKNTSTKITSIFLVQYNGVYFHGHVADCDYFRPDPTYAEKANLINRRKIYFETLFGENPFPSQINISPKHIELSPCQKKLCLSRWKWNDEPELRKCWPHLFRTHRPQEMGISSMKKAILTGNLTGLVAIQDLSISEEGQNPLFGFCVQRQTIGKKSYLKNEKNTRIPDHLAKLKARPMIVGLNKYKGVHVISTSFLKFLNDTFRVKPSFKILHVVEFSTRPYLSDFITRYISQRIAIKEEYKINPSNKLLMQAHSIKLFLNSMYGYLLLQSNNYKKTIFFLGEKLTQPKQNIKFIKELKRQNIDLVNTSPIGVIRRKKRSQLMYMGDSVLREESEKYQFRHVGSTVLWNSKKIFLTIQYLMLGCFDVAKVEWAYCDTDSLHFLFAHKTLIENVHKSMRETFLKLGPSYFNWFKNCTKSAGSLVHEGYFSKICYRTEKVYKKFDEISSNDKDRSEEKSELCMKGVKNSLIQLAGKKKTLDPFLYNVNRKFSCKSVKLRPGTSGGIFLYCEVKELKFCPLKREFRGVHSVILEQN